MEFTSMIQTHPYIALVASFIVGYGIINYTTPQKAQAPPAKKPDTTATASTTPPKTEQFFGAAEQSQYPVVNPLGWYQSPGTYWCDEPRAVE